MGTKEEKTFQGKVPPHIPEWSFTKGLVVELFPLVPASCSGRLVGSVYRGCPAELGSGERERTHAALALDGMEPHKLALGTS